MNSYHQIIQKLFAVNFFGGLKLGLENSLSLSDAIGTPQETFKSIHVAGTNGKGSVVTKIARTLEIAGYRVGLYTSPHISCFRERIQINKRLISEQEVQRLLPEIMSIADKNKIPATFFELTTCLALKYFSEENVDIAILETGIGGRLDATNIVTPLLSVITSISLEHTEILGQTIEEIAIEKGGIIKPYIPVVIGPRVPLSVIQRLARERSSPLFSISESTSNFEEENTQIARKALDLLSDRYHLKIPTKAVVEGLSMKPPCRLETHTTQTLPLWYNQPFPEALILDVAHNPDGLKHLFELLKIRYPNKGFRILFGLSKTKDIHACIAIISKYAQDFHPVEALNGRGASSESLCQLLIEFGVPQSKINTAPTIPQSLKEAIEQAEGKKQILIVCGTFFIMGECRKTLGIEEPHDPIDMNERNLVQG